MAENYVDIKDNEGGDDTKFVEVDGKKFIDDGSGQPKVGDDGQPIPFVEKQVEAPEARKARLERELSRHKEKYPDLYKDPKEKKESKKSDDLDYGQKAYLVSMGYKDPEEMEKAKEIMAFTGKPLEEVLSNKHFQAEIEEMRAIKATNNAVPPGSNRGNNNASDTVEYWIAKGELPPLSQRELRQKVVNARIAKEKNKSTFTDTPVAGK